MESLIPLLKDLRDLVNRPFGNRGDRVRIKEIVRELLESTKKLEEKMFPAHKVMEYNTETNIIGYHMRSFDTFKEAKAFADEAQAKNPYGYAEISALIYQNAGVKDD
jgi:hypothetical protein